MIEINNTTKQLIDEAALKKIVQAFLKFYHKEQWSVSIAIIKAASMKNFNECYRGVKKTTDVLSFPGYSKDKIGPGAEFKYLGEVLLNLSETKKVRDYQSLLQEIQAITLTKSAKHSKLSKLVKNSSHQLDALGLAQSISKIPSTARLTNKNIQQYLFHFLLVHGLLHLVGYNDSSKRGRREMLYLGKKFLSQQGYKIDLI